MPFTRHICERPENISRKSPNTSVSQDFAKLRKTRDYFNKISKHKPFTRLYIAAKDQRSFQEISKHERFTRLCKAVKNQRFLTKSPNTGLSQDLHSCQNQEFSRNIQTRPFHETLHSSCTKDHRLFQENLQTWAFHETLQSCENQRFSTKSPNTSLSQDLLSCEKKGFLRNIQTRAFHETLQSCKKNPAIFKHISS